MFTPCNACPACPVGQNDRTGVNSFSARLLAKNDRIGRARLDLLNRGHVIPPGLEVHRESGGFALRNNCPMKSKGYFTGAPSFFKDVSHKAPSTQREGGAFLLYLSRGT